jgi:monoamine oxidase
MMQPVGGMDRIGAAFGRKLAPLIHYGAEVLRIRKTGSGVQIAWNDRKRRGSTRAVEAPYVICTIPLPVLRAIDADFAPEIKTAMAAATAVAAGKLAFQAERRFWEIDHHIYGGISWTSRDITQIWYPSSGLHKKKGILVGAYIWSDELGEAFAAKRPAQRLDDALADGERLHPNYRASLVNGVSVAWPKIPFSRLAWTYWPQAARRDAYPKLLQGDWPILFAGEHMSYVNGWQEGAVLSAHYTIAQMRDRITALRS